MEWLLEYGDSRLRVVCDKDLRSASLSELILHYDSLVDYINRNPLFRISYEPLEVGAGAPHVARLMAQAAESCGVGPMAAVAGAFSQVVGEFLVSNGGGNIIVDNGGDIYLNLSEDKVVKIYAGLSKMPKEISLKVSAGETPMGICTSSATVGPSISLGDADAVTVVADSAVVADAAASAVGNEVKGSLGVEKGIARAEAISLIRGVVIVRGDKLGLWGSLPEIV